MAGLPWFELDVDFHEHPKVKALCSRLRNPLADSYVSRLYAYCYRHACDRFAPEVAADTIEDAVRWRGRRGVLFDALFAVEVLERDAGKVVVHGVAKRLGPHLAKRIVDAERQKRHRAKASSGIGRPSDVTRDVTRESRGDIDNDKDRDSDKAAAARAPAPAVTAVVGGERSPDPDPYPLARSFLPRLEQRMARTAPLPVGGGTEGNAEVMRQIEAALQRLPEAEAVECVWRRDVDGSSAAKGSRVRTLKLVAAVLADEVSRRATGPPPRRVVVGMDENTGEIQYAESRR